MAPKFTRRRWRRPQRLTLEGPAPDRRKDLVVPDMLTLEPALAWRENRQRMAHLLIGFLVLAALNGLGLAAIAGVAWAGPPIGILLALGYLIAGSRLGDGWMLRVVQATETDDAFVRNVVTGVAQRLGLAAPRVYVGPGDAPNALALGLRRRWLLLTESTKQLDRLELEAVVAHELTHLRDGDAALASAFVLLTGAPELGVKALGARGGVLSLLAVPLWPACVLLRLGTQWIFPEDREHRADVSGAIATRYPPGMGSLLKRSAVEHETARLRATDPFWFAPRTETRGPTIARRAELVGEM